MAAAGEQMPNALRREAKAVGHVAHFLVSLERACRLSEHIPEQGKGSCAFFRLCQVVRGEHRADVEL